MQLPFSETEQLLKQYDLPLVKTKFAKSEREILEESSSMAFPLVLKALCPRVLHKTEAGLVKMGLHNQLELERAFHELNSKCPSHEGFLLQETASGVELFVGAKRDQAFGPVITFGFGGFLVELLEGRSTRVCPISEQMAIEMINETKVSKLVQGYRGKKINEKVIAGIIAGVSRMMMENVQLQELDLNPILASENSTLIVDPRILVL